MNGLKILNGIKKFVSSKPTRLAMPGHKGKDGFNVNLFALDVTELPAIDNERIVNDAEIDVAKILGASSVKFLTGGSTAGVFAMLFAVKELGKKIVINRNAHKSVYNALKLFGIEPIIVDGGRKNGVADYPSVKAIIDALARNDDAIGVLITYPDYYGRNYDIKELSVQVKKRNKLLLIDGAHGAHYKFIGCEYAGYYADLWVDGSHKTMPTLNQGGIVCSNDGTLTPRLREWLDINSTTSPSYPILASIEYGVKYMAKYGKAKTEKLKVALAELKANLFSLGLTVMEYTDAFKLAVDFGGAGYSSKEIERELIKNNIHAEMNDGRYILFMFSAFTAKRDIKKLFGGIKKAVFVCDKKEAVIGCDVEPPKRKISYLKAVNSEYELVPLADAVGKVSADNVGLFPPCYPVLTAGEIISKASVKALSGRDCFGLIDGKIKVVKE